MINNVFEIMSVLSIFFYIHNIVPSFSYADSILYILIDKIWAVIHMQRSFQNNGDYILYDGD